MQGLPYGFAAGGGFAPDHRMGGAKRYPSMAGRVGDGFRKRSTHPTGHGLPRNRGSLICPTCPACRAKLFRKRRIYFLPFFRNLWFDPRIPLPVRRGVWPIATNVGTGCDGRGSVARRAIVSRTSKAAWSRFPDAGIKSARDGGRRRLSSPALRGERGISRKPLRRERRTVSAYLW